MNKGELVSAIAEKSGLTKSDAEKSLAALLETIKETIAKGEDIQLIGFGTFARSERKERQGFNPKTGEKMTIAASKNAKFKVGAALKAAMNS